MYNRASLQQHSSVSVTSIFIDHPVIFSVVASENDLIEHLKNSERDFLDLIDNIYDAAFDPDGWQGVLDGLHHALPMAGIGLHGMHSGPNPAYFFIHQGYDPHTTDEFVSTYAEISPWPKLLPQFATGDIFVPNRCHVADKFHNTDFYSFLERKNIGAGVAAMLSNESDRTFHLSFDYSLKLETRMSDPIFEFVSKLAPHMSRSFATSHKTALARNGFDSLASMIGHLAVPAILVDGALKMRACNDAGEQFFKTCSGLKRDGRDQLTLIDMTADTALRHAVKSITNFEFTKTAPATISFHSTNSTAPGRITALPLKADKSLSHGSMAHHLACPERLALLVITSGSSNEPLLAEIFQIRFGFTKAQTKLACALCYAMSLDQYAAKNGVKISTVRNHLQALFEKTNTHQQSQLVALLMENATSW